eukprot:gb/GECH01002513.1/.p1 GENE.gb/GECH01002513.1/~~gb/GECH01002513.1/.p1  ORF type:complete len:224 (+),score=37.23 gb/GECH01002513.1/:1-672(+)
MPVLTKRHQPVDYIIVIDFEATCVQQRDPTFVNEIIEFPAVVVDTRSRGSSRILPAPAFHSYVHPVDNPILSEFCTQLTGIEQCQVDAAPPLPTVLHQFDAWLTRHRFTDDVLDHDTLLPGEEPFKTFSIATDGPWDITSFLGPECQRNSIPMPSYFSSWIDVRQLFAQFYGGRRKNLARMLEHLSLTFEGRPHSGIDDSRNIAKIVACLINDGAILETNCHY